MARTYVIRGEDGDTLTLEGIDVSFPRITVALSYFDDVELTTPSASPVGTFAVEGITNGGQTYATFANSPIDAEVDGSFASAASPIQTIRVTPTGASGHSYYQVTVTCNES